MKGINNRQKTVVKSRQTPERNLLSTQNLKKSKKPGVDLRPIQLFADKKWRNQK